MKRAVWSFLLVVTALTSNMAFATWTATVTGASIVTLPGTDPGRRIVRVMISFTDGKQVIDGVPFESINPSTTTISDFCKARTAQYDYMDAFVANPPIGPVDTLAIVPTADDLAKAKYFSDKAKLDFLTQQVTDKALDATDPDYLALIDTVKTEFRKEYLNLP